MRRGLRLWVAAAALLLAMLLHPGAAAQSTDTIVIGAKNFAESRLLAEIMAQRIEASTDLRVDRRFNLGGTTVVFTALRHGEIDLYAEYTGTAWRVQLQRSEPLHSPLHGYVSVQRGLAERWDLEVLPPLGFSNSYALAMTEARAQALGVQRISDLRGRAKALRFGFSHEFIERDDGFAGLVGHYDLEAPTPRGMEHGLAYQALAQGEVDVIDTYTTDGKLARFDVRLLEDDARFFPPYDAVPIVRREALREHPQLREALGPLAFALSNDRMQALNDEVEGKGRDFAIVAREFLDTAGLGSGEPTVSAPKSSDRSLLATVWSHRGRTLDRLLEHLLLTAVAVGLAIAIAVPLGLWLSRHPRWAGGIIGGTAVIQTIPSLALLALMIPIPGLGLGATSAIIALLLYALLPIVRNTYAGITEVDPELVEAARGMGMRDGQILRIVELPLAMRTIMAGIRTSTVISVGVATLAAFIGAGGLGDPIVTGLQLNDTGLILSGALPAAALAIVIDAGLGWVERRLVPRGLAIAR